MEKYPRRMHPGIERLFRSMPGYSSAGLFLESEGGIKSEVGKKLFLSQILKM